MTWGTEGVGAGAGHDAEQCSVSISGTSPGCLKYLHQHQEARQSPAACRTRVGQLDLLAPPWPGVFTAADVLSSSLNPTHSERKAASDRLKDEKPYA